MTYRLLDTTELGYIIHRTCAFILVSWPVQPFVLSNAPVVEAWASLTFEGNPDGPIWGPERAQNFVVKYSEEYPKAEYITREEVQLLRGTPTTLPTVVSRAMEIDTVRIHDLSKTRWLQVSQDRLAHNIVPSRDPYPGFDVLREGLLEKLPDYVEHFQPVSVVSATLFYMDVVEIPRSTSDPIVLSKFFTTVPDINPHPFGNVARFRHRNVFHCPVDDGTLIFDLESLNEPTPQPTAKFRMMWQKESKNIRSLNAELIRARLNTSHEYLLDCFKHSVTDTTWSFFNQV